MRKIILIDNFDSFTYNLVDYFKRQGVGVTIFRNTVSVDFIRRQRPDLLIYSPGPGLPAYSGNLMDYIREFRGQVPQFGVCLGLQAMIEACGGTLRNLKHPMHGKASAVEHDGISIFKGLPNPFMAGRYHSWVADLLPNGFEVSATIDDSKTVMAIRHKRDRMEGVQFHPESILTMKDGIGEKIIQNISEYYL